MNGSVLHVAWMHRWSFLAVTIVTFLIFASIILLRPPSRSTTIRSVIEIGSIAAEEYRDFVDTPDQAAKHITSVVIPLTVRALGQQGVSQTILSQLQNATVENSGRSVVLTNVVDQENEKVATEFQRKIINTIIEERTRRVQLARDMITAEISFAEATIADSEQQKASIKREIENISANSDQLWQQIRDNQTALSKAHQGISTSQGQEPDEARDRELRNQIATATALRSSLTIERSGLVRDLTETNRLVARQASILARAKHSRQMFNDTFASLDPTVLPTIGSKTRPLSLLLAALAVAILAGFGTVVLLHNYSTKSS